MNDSFENQLTEQQIKAGVWHYVKKRFLFFQSMVAIVVILAAMVIWSVLDGTIFNPEVLIFVLICAVFVVILAGLLSFSYRALLKQFGDTKKAKYVIQDTELVIIDDAGKETQYPWIQMIACLEKKDIYILILNRQRFCILTKEAAASNIDIIRKKIKEAYHG